VTPLSNEINKKKQRAVTKRFLSKTLFVTMIGAVACGTKTSPNPIGVVFIFFNSFVPIMALASVISL